MNKLFFLLPVLIGLLIIPSVSSAYAQTVVGANYIDTVVGVTPDGSTEHRIVIDLGVPRIFDGFNYQDYLFSDLPTYLQVETMGASVTLHKSTCEFSFHNKGLINENPIPLLTDDIIPFQTVNGTGNWNKVTSIDNETCQTSWNGSELVAKKVKSGMGTMEYAYILDSGKWKTELRVHNDSGLNNRQFGFQQIIDLNRETINWGGSVKTLDNHDGSVFDRTWLENNEGKIIDLLNGYNFDFDLGFDNLDYVFVNDTGVGSSRLTFGYFHDQDILLHGATLIIDPSLTFSGADLQHEDINEDDGDNVCEDTGGTYTSHGGAQLSIFVAASGGGADDCWRGWLEYDISTIPDTATITDVSLELEVNFAWDTTPMDIYGITSNQPSTRTDAQQFDEINDDNLWVDATTAFTVANPNLTLDLGITADSDVQSMLASDWIGIGMLLDSETVDASNHGQLIDGKSSGGTPELELTIEYNTGAPAPNAVEDLALGNVTATSIDLAWTEPDLKTGNLTTGYQINYTTPHGDPDIIIENNTISTIPRYTHTSLTASTQYSYRVSAWTEGGNNATGNIANGTTLSFFPPYDVNATAVSGTQINLEWTAPATGDTPTGYRIFQESPVGGGWAVLVSNTTNTNQFYNNTGLTASTQYNYMIASLTSIVSGNSSAVAENTFGIPSPVTDLSIGSATVSTLTLSWTTPDHNGFPITGYKIERESPVGGGWATLVNDTGTTDITYLDTSLSSITEYNYRLYVWNSQGSSTVGNEANGTTVTEPPTGLTVNDNYHTLTTQLNLEWTAPVPSTGVNGYKIEHRIPPAAFSVLVANTTNTNVVYNHTGLTTGIIHDYRVIALSAAGESQVSNTYDYTTHHIPDVIDDLQATATSLSSIFLNWTEPVHYATEIQGYAVNYTTPTGDPLTVISSNTGSTSTEYTVTGIPVGSTNSFRVAAVTEHTPPLNTTGANIANATSFSNFEIGNLSFPTESNPNILPVLFDETKFNATTIDLDVRYPNTVSDFRCDFDYEFAQTNKTYSGFAATVYDASYDNSTFRFIDIENEIVDAFCWDNANTAINGTHKITQQSFPFVDLINDFQDGQFNTDGTFGILDLITLLVVIVSMIGFNKENPAVGLVIAVMVLGAASFFEIIALESTLLGALALVVMLAIVATRKRN